METKTPEMQKAEKDLEEISKEVSATQISDTSSDDSMSSDEEKSHTEDSMSSDEEKQPTIDPPRVVLDLDNTLLHAIHTRSFHKKYKDKASKRKIAENMSNIKVYDIKDDDERYYLVF